jgi:hypothetical protein
LDHTRRADKEAVIIYEFVYISNAETWLREGLKRISDMHMWVKLAKETRDTNILVK